VRSLSPSVPTLGRILLEVGNPAPALVRTRLADALFSPVQQRVLGLLFGQPERQFGSGELIRLVGSGTGAPHRILTRLAEAGLVTVTRVGNQKHYQANRESPIFDELHGLAIKTVGLVEPLRRALEPLAPRIRAAFVYGSLAKGTDRARSDLDLLVISDDLGHTTLYEALESAEALLARRVDPIVFGPDEWRSKRSVADSFASRVAKGPRLFVLGSEAEAL
jgi:predicted nucleotidyltransferase